MIETRRLKNVVIFVKTILFQEHLDLTLDIKLNFSEYIKSITKKIVKGMGLLRKFQQILPRSSLLTFRRTRLDYRYHL